MIPMENYPKFKRYNKILIVGGVIFTFGVILLLFFRPYVFDGSQRDLFLVFSLVAMIPGGLLMFYSGVKQCKLWHRGRNGKFSREGSIVGTGPEAVGEYQRGWVAQSASSYTILAPDPPYNPPSQSLVTQPVGYATGTGSQSQLVAGQPMRSNYPSATDPRTGYSGTQQRGAYPMQQRTAYPMVHQSTAYPQQAPSTSRYNQPGYPATSPAGQGYDYQQKQYTSRNEHNVY